MLETKNLVKIYKPKGGVPVVALNNINLKLPKTGMVFILGKSGSGKSTLLNVLGGLDGFTSGDILVKGESTKGFKQAQYDSYRNTYVGFIFQEYNVLNEFTVGANIALAIELQGRKATNEEINDILVKVDLQEYGDRKPTELSGGQKQRVAIARALVKNPEIIMADEPTGALDSVTGKQVFDTLKDLSRDKLVLVVSHDRDFAETYANRIIELADGKIISDVSVTHDYVEEKIEDIKYNKNNIVIKHGYQLTEADRIAINEYLSKLKTDAIITNQELEESKNATRFITTNQEYIETDTEGFKLIKSKLSLKNSFKIGASGLKHKKFKLVMTILLSVVAFTLFGFSDTFASFNMIQNTTKSLIDSNIDYASYVKQEKITYYDDYSYYNDLKLTDEDIKTLNEKTGLTFNGVYTTTQSLDYSDNISIDTNNEDQYRLQNMFPQEFSGFVEFDNADLKAYDYTLIGNLPDGSKNELAISSYAYEFFKETKYISKDNNISTISKEEDLIGKILTIKETDYTITGIIDTGLDYERYRKLSKDYDKLTTSDLLVYYALMEELNTITQYSLHSVAFVGDGFIEKYKNDFPFTDTYYFYGYVGNGDYEYYCNYSSSMNECKNDVLFFDSTKTSINDDEIVLSAIAFEEMFGYKNSSEDLFKSLYPTTKFRDVDDTSNTLVDLLDEQECRLLMLASIIKASNTTIEEMKNEYPELSTINDNPTDYEVAYRYALIQYKLGYNAVKDEYKTIIDYIYTTLDLSKAIKCGGGSWNDYSYSSYSEGTKKLVGVSLNKVNDDTCYILFSDSIYENTIKGAGYLNYAVSSMPTKYQDVKKLVELTYKDEVATNRFYLTNSVTFEMDTIKEVLDVLAVAFLWIGVGFAVFASLMLSNFIANSISYKKRDIGILRAIGSRSSDVFKIFFAESFIIAMINYVITMILITVITIVINSAIRNNVGLLITALNLGPRQFFLMFGVCLLVAAIATFLPVYKNARKKPIDAIQGR